MTNERIMALSCSLAVLLIAISFVRMPEKLRGGIELRLEDMNVRQKKNESNIEDLKQSIDKIKQRLGEIDEMGERLQQDVRKTRRDNHEEQFSL